MHHVAIRPGTRQGLEQQRADPLAAYEAISGRIEGEAPAIGAEHAGPGLTQVAVAGQDQADPAGECRLAFPRPKRHAGPVHRQEPAAARRIHHLGRPSEIEGAGNPAGQHADRHVRQSDTLHPAGLAQPVYPFLEGVGDEDPDAAAGQAARCMAGILQRCAAGLQQQTGLRIHASRFAVANAEQRRVEALDIRDEAAAWLRHGPARRQDPAEPPFRHRAEQGITGHDRCTKGREIRRRCEAAGHAHYGDIVAADRALCHRFLALPRRCSQRRHSPGTATSMMTGPAFPAGVDFIDRPTTFVLRCRAPRGVRRRNPGPSLRDPMNGRKCSQDILSEPARR